MLSSSIRALRLSRGISQVELAAALCVSKQSVSNWENDNIQPSIDMLVKLSKYFGVPTDRLLCLDDRRYVEVTGLTVTEMSHVRMLVEDILASRHEP